MKVSIHFDIDASDLTSYSDAYLAQLWHIAQANPAPIRDREAGRFAELVGREVIRRWLAASTPELWRHQGEHHYWAFLADNGHWPADGGPWVNRRAEAALSMQARLVSTLQQLITEAARDEEGAPNSVSLFDAKALLDEIKANAGSLT